MDAPAYLIKQALLPRFAGARRALSRLPGKTIARDAAIGGAPLAVGMGALEGVGALSDPEASPMAEGLKGALAGLLIGGGMAALPGVIGRLHKMKQMRGQKLTDIQTLRATTPNRDDRFFGMRGINADQLAGQRQLAKPAVGARATLNKLPGAALMGGTVGAAAAWLNHGRGGAETKEQA